MTPREALEDVCRRFCLPERGRHDDACLVLTRAVADASTIAAGALRDAAEAFGRGPYRQCRPGVVTGLRAHAAKIEGGHQ